MKVVIDTNIVVSAVLKDRDPETVILFVIGNPDFEWVASREIVEKNTSVYWAASGLLYRRKFWTSGQIFSMKS